MIAIATINIGITNITEAEFNEKYNSDSIIHKGTFATGDSISLADETGRWYLWILAKDNLGNTTVISSETFYIDNTAPTVGTVALTHTIDDGTTKNYNVDTWTKHSVTITLTDGYDGEGESGHADTIYNITGTYKNANGEYVDKADAAPDLFIFAFCHFYFLFSVYFGYVTQTD